MSVIVKGMRKPQSCGHCVLCLDDSRICNGYCMIFHRRVDMETLDADCPIVEVPPHGRLIDADAIHYSRIRIAHNDGTIGGYNAVVMSAEIKDAPTIIESEDET